MVINKLGYFGISTIIKKNKKLKNSGYSFKVRECVMLSMFDERSLLN